MVAAKLVRSRRNGTGVGMRDPHRDGRHVRGPRQGDDGGREVVLCHGELACFRSKVGKDRQRSQPAQGAGHAPPCRPVDQAGADDAHPTRPRRPLNGQLGPAVVLASPRVGRHRRQRDRPVNPLGESSIEQRDGAEDVRPPNIRPLREGQVVRAVDEQVHALEGLGLVCRGKVEEDVVGSGGGRPDQSTDAMAGGLERADERGAQVARGTGDGDDRPRTRGHPPAFSASLAMRWAFAMIVKVKVVAGTSENTEASTRWMRSQAARRPVLSVVLADRVGPCGKLAPK